MWKLSETGLRLRFRTGGDHKRHKLRFPHAACADALMNHLLWHSWPELISARNYRIDAINARPMDVGAPTGFTTQSPSGAHRRPLVPELLQPPRPTGDGRMTRR
jgi:hypothetical protein